MEGFEAKELSIEEYYQHKLDETKQKLTESENRYKYLLADLDNMRKRHKEEIERNNKFKNKDLILKLIEVVDNCERSMEYNNNESPVYSQMLTILKNEGVERLDIRIGMPFDVNAMEAFSVTSGNRELEDNTVSCIIKNGYSYHGEIIRFANVMVERK